MRRPSFPHCINDENHDRHHQHNCGSHNLSHRELAQIRRKIPLPLHASHKEKQHDGTCDDKYWQRSYAAVGQPLENGLRDLFHFRVSVLGKLIREPCQMLASEYPRSIRTGFVNFSLTFKPGLPHSSA